MNDNVSTEMQWYSADARSRMAAITPPRAQDLTSRAKPTTRSILPRVAAAAIVITAATMVFFRIDSTAPPTIDVPSGLIALVEDFYEDSAGGRYVAESIAPFFSSSDGTVTSFGISDPFMSGVWNEVSDQ